MSGGCWLIPPSYSSSSPGLAGLNGGNVGMPDSAYVSSASRRLRLRRRRCSNSCEGGPTSGGCVRWRSVWVIKARRRLRRLNVKKGPVTESVRQNEILGLTSVKKQWHYRGNKTFATLCRCDLAPVCLLFLSTLVDIVGLDLNSWQKTWQILTGKIPTFDQTLFSNPNYSFDEKVVSFR